MKVTFSGKQVDVSDKLRRHVEEGISVSVEKYFPKYGLFLVYFFEILYKLCYDGRDISLSQWEVYSLRAFMVFRKNT